VGGLRAAPVAPVRQRNRALDGGSPRRRRARALRVEGGGVNLPTRAPRRRV